MTPAARTLRPAIFLDRDGTLIVEEEYLADPARVALERGAIAGLRRLRQAGFALVVISNQSGVGRGMFGVDAVERVNARVADLLAAEGIAVEGWYFCPHAPDEDCDCRKPGPGMALQAAAELGLDLAQSFVIGDKRSDVECAWAMGGRGVLVLTGHGTNDLDWASRQGVTIAAELDEAARGIISGVVPAQAAALDDLKRSARAWLRDLALPLWGTTGFDAETDAFHELLGFGGRPDPAAPRRLMVQARQIAVFARAALEGDFQPGRHLACRAGANMIARYLEVDGGPGWVFSVDGDGHVVNASRDLYAHAFALFALAWLRRLGPDTRVDEAIARTFDVLDTQFHDALGGGYWDSLPRQPGMRHQNPHMHLFEALIELATDDPDPRLRARCAALDRLARQHFLGPGGTLREAFTDAWDVSPGTGLGSVEPGHQMEWAVLWSRYQALTGEDRTEIVDALVERAIATGISPDGRVVDECGEDGLVRKHSSRSWPHTEAARALALQIARGRQDRLPLYLAIVDRLLRNFCNPALGGGWVDHFDGEDQPISRFMPASSFYHIYFGLKSLDTLR